VGTATKEESANESVLGCWISSCYDPFSLGARFKTFQRLIYLIFTIFSGRGKTRKTETADTESVHMGARLYSGLNSSGGF
jgi:hypothetical protein